MHASKNCAIVPMFACFSLTAEDDIQTHARTLELLRLGLLVEGDVGTAARQGLHKGGGTENKKGRVT